ncbi:MAG: aspartate decarboxylase [Oceanicaulis sp.]
MSDAKAALGSKANPSQYDCLPDLAEDEPYFVIRADDPLASEIMELTRERAPRPAGSPKYRETFAISQSMEKWRHEHGK